MSLSLDEIKRIAHLARIEIGAAEAVRAQGQLNDIFSLVEAMSIAQAVSTSSGKRIDPTRLH